MGERIELEKELEGIKSEGAKLVEYLSNIDASLDSGAVAEMMEQLIEGETAASIIDYFDLTED
jgi:hypothetical protein